MGNHSPGPWDARPAFDGGWEVRAADGNAVTGWGRVQQTDANACLIAAAPNLLEAAKVAADLLAREPVNSRGRRLAEAKALELLKKAIAKAEPQL